MNEEQSSGIKKSSETSIYTVSFEFLREVSTTTEFARVTSLTEVQGFGRIENLVLLPFCVLYSTCRT